jgi:molybdopterin-dependent oxidoreductase alpha subunit
MTTRAPRDDFDEQQRAPRIEAPETWSTGIPSVLVAVKRTHEEMGPVATARTLSKLNHTDGFDCPGCAWPDPDPEHRKLAEFCENGVKHVSAEATGRRLDAAFFARHSVKELATRSDWWLEEQGRLVEPVVKRPGSEHFKPATWNEALDLVASELTALDDPGQAVFYTSGRASNEAAFIYQLFVRAFGTNNLPDCSNMCHESSGTALGEVLGVGKGSCTLDDLEHADLIVICGQNPGSNHPRMLTHLERAKRNGASIVAVNPLREAGLLRFKNPQSARGSLGPGTTIADDYLLIRLAGDQALFLGLGKLLLEAEAAAPGTVLDQAFVDTYTDGFAAYRAHAAAADWADIEAGCGLPRPRIEDLARRWRESRATIVCWAMGLTQHRNSVSSIREIANALLLRGDIGRRGAGVFPVRGHSNVQGDRTMGIWEQMPDRFLDALRDEFGFDPPRQPGWDSVDAVTAMGDGRARLLFSLGGNLVRAISDSQVAESALSSLRTTVSVATKLNRTHTTAGEVAVILPTLGRSERDPAGSVTVEDSVGQVHASQGVLTPAGPLLRSEVDIVCDLATRVLGEKVPVPWPTLAADYGEIRDHIARVIPGFENFNDKVARPGGFLLPHPARDSRTFPTSNGKAHFSVNPLQVLEVPPGRLLLQTIRSHDQFNTTIYSYNDRYRGIHGSRQVVLVNPDDLAVLDVAAGDRVDVVTEWDDGIDRRLEDLRVVSYPTARGCCAAYFPEANVLIPLGSVAEGSNTPTSKSVVVRLEPRPSV